MQKNGRLQRLHERAQPARDDRMTLVAGMQAVGHEPLAADVMRGLHAAGQIQIQHRQRVICRNLQHRLNAIVPRAFQKV